MASLAGQETVRSVRLVADLTAVGGGGTVRMEYTLESGEPGSMIPATVLDFGPSAATNLRFGEARNAAPLRALTGVARGAEVGVEPSSSPGTGRVVIHYDLASPVTSEDGDLRGHVPVLSLDRPPTQPGPGVFTAELRLPPEWLVVEGFPTGLSATGKPGVYTVSLSVVPAVVSFRGRSDGRWRPGLPLGLEVLAGIAMVGFGLYGWRHLRRVAG
jgi:hypothetical protein